jgi:hypothetical protein
MYKKSMVIPIFIFIINPFFGMLSIILLKILINKRESKSDLLLFVFMTSYVCLLQSTRIWNIYFASDWNGGYLELFQKVEDTSAFTYIFMQKDPVWNLLNYIGFYLNSGSAFLFLNEIAIFTIFLTSLSIFIYWKSTKANPITLIASLALVLFFTEYFSQINNLLRQFFSLSIVVYAYVRKVTLNRSGLWLLIIASLVHYLSFLFLLFYIIKPLYEKISIIQIFKLIGFLLFGLFILSNLVFFQNLFSQIPFLLNGINRLMLAGSPGDSNFLDPAVVSFNALFLIFIAIVLSGTGSVSKGMVFFANIAIATMLLSMSLATIAPEIMGRIYITRFYLFPFILPYFLMHIKTLHNVYIYSVILFFFLRFLLTFDSIRGEGFFPPISEILTYSIFHFIL